MLRNLNLNHHPHAGHHVVSAASSASSAAAVVVAASAGVRQSAAAAVATGVGAVPPPLAAAMSASTGFSIYSRNISFEQDYRSNYTYQNAQSATSSCHAAAGGGQQCNSLLSSPERTQTTDALVSDYRTASSAEGLVAGLKRNGFYIVKSPLKTVAAKGARTAYTVGLNRNNNNNSTSVANNNHAHGGCVGVSKGMVESLHNYSKQQCEEETDRLRHKALARGYNDDETEDDEDGDEDDEDVDLVGHEDGVTDTVVPSLARDHVGNDDDDDVDDDDDEAEELVIDEPAPTALVDADADAAAAAETGRALATVAPEHHARRPMNAFLIFCKRHRGIVREKYPNLENRAITKILGDWWANMDAAEKECFNRLAREYKDAFFNANPTFQWYKLPAPPLRTLHSRPVIADYGHPDVNSHQSATSTLSASHVGMFKLADEAQMGGLNELMTQPESASSPAKGRSEADRKSSDLQAALGDATSFFAKTMSTNRTEPFRHYRTVKRRSDPGADSSPPPPAKRSVSESSIVTSPADFERFVQANFKLAEEDDSNDQSTSGTPMATAEPGVGYTKSTRACKGKRYLEFIHTVRVATAAPKKAPKSGAAALHTTTAHTPESASVGHQQSATPRMDYDHMYASPAPASAVTVASNCTTATNTPAKPSALGNDSTSDFDLDGKINRLLALSLDEYLSRKRDTKKRKRAPTKRATAPMPTAYTAAKRTKHSTTQSLHKLQQAAQAQAHQQQSMAQSMALERREQLQSAAVGSQKRKARKESITRRDVVAMATAGAAQPLSALPLTAPPVAASPEPQLASPDLFILAQVAAIITSK